VVVAAAEDELNDDRTEVVVEVLLHNSRPLQQVEVVDVIV
jgi:hypothetical protein